MLQITAFRRLWVVLGLSSLGDWLGLLATALIASEQVTGSTAKGAAFGGVVVVRLLPAMLLGPVAGAFADRFDRRHTMIVCDLLRFALFASIPLVGLISWTLAASFVIEVVGMFWIPAKEAAVPNLVGRDQLEPANQVSLLTTYGLAPIAASLLFAGLATSSRLVGEALPRSYIGTNQSDLALYFNALTFLATAITVVFIPEISGRGAKAAAGAAPASFLRSALDGVRFVGRTPLIRGLVIGILGAFAAGGVVVGAGKFYAAALGGGDATFSLLFGAIFVGLALGMGFGPRLARNLSRRRAFGEAIVAAGGSVVLLCFAPYLGLAMVITLAVGFGAGLGFVEGMTLLGGEVEDSIRGRTFAFIQSMVRVVLMLSIAVTSLLVGLGGRHSVRIGDLTLMVPASRLLLLAGGLLAIAVGVLSFRQIDDKPGVPVLADLFAALRGRRLSGPGRRGTFVAFEGGEGAGKSTQVRLLADWLASEGHECVVTAEPGGTDLGQRIRQLVLDRTGQPPSSRAEALLYAADRADHVDRVIRPALDRGAVVVTDRFLDSSLAYQGAGRQLEMDEVAGLSRWATQGLHPDLVVLLDIPPQEGLARAGRRSAADRLEAESVDFHVRVRNAFLGLADGDGGRYLVLDATRPAEELASRVRERIAPLLSPRPDGPPGQGSG